jgi:hypothetical protein
MLNKSIRNIGISGEFIYQIDSSIKEGDERGKEPNLCHIINDRKILEFLLSHNGRQVLLKDGIAGLADININNNLHMISPTTVKSYTTVSRAAELLMDIHNPCLILESDEKESKENRYIITPWDIVMKLLRPDDVKDNT